MQTEMSRGGLLHPELIYELTRNVAAATGIEEIYDAALTCLGASLGVTKSSILLFDEAGVMRFRAWRNLSDGYRAAVDGHSPWAPDTLNPEPVTVADVRLDDSLAQLRPTIEGEGIRSLAFIPLVAGSRLIGKFMVYFPEPHEFGEVELLAAQVIAGQVAFAIEQQIQRETNLRLDAVNRLVIDSFGVAVYTTDEHGAITRFNEAAADLWGRRPVLGEEQWCGSWKIYWPDGSPMDLADCPMGVALRERRAVRGWEIIVERPDGGRRTVLPHPTPLIDDEGSLIGAVNVLVDISEQAAMRTELAMALQAKDDFLGQVSHELRTPLTQLIGNAHHLTRPDRVIDDATRQESLHEILAQSQRMQRLIDNMSVLSRLERGILPELEPQLLQRVAGATLEEFIRRHPATTVAADLPVDLPAVDSNPATIDQVLWNLLTNAQKYGPSEGPVAVTALAEGGEVAVVVRDNGPGIDVRELEELFQPYYRSPRTAARNPGLGLGLSVCKILVESQGGRIWAMPLRPRGLEVGFALPISQA